MYMLLSLMAQSLEVGSVQEGGEKKYLDKNIGSGTGRGLSSPDLIDLTLCFGL